MLTQEILSTNEQNIDTVFTSTTYEYNAGNLVTKKIDFGGRTTSSDGSHQYNYKRVESYKYYPNGDLREKTDRSNSETIQNGAVTTYEYDIHGRLRNQTTEQTGKTTVSITNEYDNNGNKLSIIDATGTTVRTYDEINRVKTKNVPGIGTVNYYYDIIMVEGTDKLIAEKSVDPKGNKTVKIYDPAGRIKYVYDGEIPTYSSISSLDATKLTTYQYKDTGARESVQYPIFVEGGITYRFEEVYNYYDDGMLYSLTNQKVKYEQNEKIIDTQIEKYIYIYDNAHNCTKKLESLSSGSKYVDYTYTALNQLKTVDESNGTFTEYDYDLAGNRDIETIIKNGTTTQNDYNYNYLNQLANIVTTGATSITQTYDYDERGNQISVTRTEGSVTTTIATYSYDLLNRLTSATSEGSTVSYTYNGEGLRVTKNDGSLTRYLYEYDKVVLEVDGNGNQKGRNIYGTNLLMRQADGLSLYYMYNGHADVTALLEATTGTTRATYYYDAFGNIQEQKYYTASGIETTTPINNSIMYAGYQYDKETGLYYLNARMYDPKIARFLQEDTYTGTATDPLSLNLYTYCANNPLIYIDPTGHYYINGMHVSEFWQKQKEDIVNLDKLFTAYDEELTKYRGSLLVASIPSASLMPMQIAPQDDLENRYLMLQYLQRLMLENSILQSNTDIMAELAFTTLDGYLVDDLTMGLYRGHLLGDDRSQRIIKDASNNELIKSGKQALFGSSWTKEEDITALGTLLEINIGLAGGLIGVDAPLDIRDLAGDFTNWKWSWGHVGGTAIDAVSLLPLVGAFKSADKVKPLLKTIDEADSYSDGFSKFAKTGFGNGSELVSYARKPSDIFFESGIKPGEWERIAPKNLHRELRSSQIGRETLDIIEQKGIDIDLYYDTPPANVLGRAIGKDTLVYVKNTQSVKRTAQTVIHEVTHSGLQIAGSQRAEVIAFMRAAKHTNPNLSFGDIRNIINEVKSLYPDLPYRIGG